jgi:pimeloyl-ACP methyl ester carboxylesterase
MRVGARLEQQALANRPPAPAIETRAIALSIDGGHVRSVRDYQVRSFEVMLAQVSNDDGKQVVFSSMPAEADRQQDQLRGVLQGLGATPTTPVTILSDGAEGPRSLGEAASLGPTHHVLDWFHLSMRIQHAAQAAKGWPDASAKDRKVAASLELAGFKLDGVVQKITCPVLLLHGEGDEQIPLPVAQKCFDAGGSADKTMRVFSREQGGYHHCQIDNLSVGVAAMWDWIEDRLNRQR